MFSELEDQINYKLHADHEKLSQELIQDIDPEIITKYNSINVFLGRAGSGKSFNILQTFAKISLVSSNTHLIIYINKTGVPNDRTYLNIFKDLIKIPIIFCSYENAVPTVNEILHFKKIYQKIKDKHLEYRINPEKMEELFDILHIDSFDEDWLHTIIYFEDAHKNPLIYGNTNKLYFINQLPLFRHDKVSYYFALQVFTQFPTDIKTQITDLFLFPGYSSRQVKFILDNVNIEMSKDDFLKEYNKLEDKEFIRIDNEQGKIEII